MQRINFHLERFPPDIEGPHDDQRQTTEGGKNGIYRMMAPVFEDKKEGPDKSFFRRASCALAPLGVLAFWGGILMAARRYPSEYDWRYMPVSNLLSSGRNPAGHLWASTGVVLCSLYALCWTAVLVRRWKLEGAGDRPRGIRALQFGYFFLMCAAVLPEWLLPIQKGHEILAVLAFAGLCIGMVRLMFQTMERTLLRRMRRFIGHARLYAAILSGAAVLPILLAGLAQAYVHYVLPELHWVSLSWRARGMPVYLSFAFWEWVTCVVLSAYMAALSLATHAVYPTRKAGEGT